MTTPYKLVMTTCETAMAASTLATKLVNLKLAACVNILPNVESVYMWEGEVTQSCETKLFIKTRAEKITSLVHTISDLHDYVVPEIQVIDITNGNSAYFNWIDEVIN
jgi:periplasmic divalent cation tolerance protein